MKRCGAFRKQLGDMWGGHRKGGTGEEAEARSCGGFHCTCTPKVACPSLLAVCSLRPGAVFIPCITNHKHVAQCLLGGRFLINT